jgi:hypothetical protein
MADERDWKHFADAGKRLASEEKIKRSEKLWKKLVKELEVLQDNNYTARKLFDYVEKHYAKPIHKPNSPR